MATIDLHGRGGSVDAAGVVIRQTHSAVCSARSSRPHDHRNLCVHDRRGTRRKLVSEHRAVTANGADMALRAPLSELNPRPSRRVVVLVLASAAALGVLCLVLVRTFDPAAGGRPVLLVLALAAIVGAVIMNAVTIDGAGSISTSRQPPEANREA